ncbi:transcriptional regulatory protein DegU [mine drainage metagenome]|uniref:Transcriptional regulatory protein DegU n=1 Tax=mine drainage metagenome TaxID=410659 RepID=A0A1J5RC95_9ZZZZ
MSETALPAVLIADDHPLFREALQSVAAEALPHCRLMEVADHGQALDLARRLPEIEMIFLDLNMPGMDGLNGLVALRNAVPAAPIVVVSAQEDAATMREAITLGAAGFMPKSLSKAEMVAAVAQVLEGALYLPDSGAAPESDAGLAEGIAQLTQQQRVVLQLLVNGQSNKRIAYELGIVESTVKAHVSAILRKLKVHSRTQAVIKAGKILAALRQAAP